ncbi:helix-turn-helix domain-containing protein [Chitinophaga japonensis]|nr:hypothetical protein [Chitinophaga japonensis]
MNFKLIKTEEDYNEAIHMMEALGDREDFEDNPDLISQFELIAKLVQLYEEEHAPVTQGHPIDIILMKMEYMDLKQKDLVPVIGSSGVVSEVLNKKRAMSKKMIRAFSEILKIDQDILNTPYELTKPTQTVANTALPSNKKAHKLFQFADTSQTLAFKERVRKTGMLMAIC